jgi:uncharacterized tellurite resistance protein B-like protein
MWLFGGKKLKIQDKLGDFAGACYFIAASDGTVSDEERETIARSIVRLSGSAVTLEKIQRMLDQARAAIQSQGLENYLKSLGRGLDRDGRVELLGGAAMTLAADGQMADEEAAAYLRLAKILGFSRDEADQILAEVT